jgi:hypothetical protein
MSACRIHLSYYSNPIGFYVKTMFAHGSHLGWRSWSLDTIFSIGFYVKAKSSHGGHLEFPIGKWFTSLVQDHTMIIPVKSQFNWPGGVWQEDFLNFSQWKHIMDPGSQVEFQICTKNTILVEDHPMNMCGKFGSILFSGFREEDLNVKS